MASDPTIEAARARDAGSGSPSSREAESLATETGRALERAAAMMAGIPPAA